jgi:hypothetical protein
MLRAIVAAAGSGLTLLPEPLDATIEPTESDDLPINRLANLLAVFAGPPIIWLPRTSGGHTRQFLPRHVGGTVKSTGSAVFDTFAAISKETPVVFEWADVSFPPGDQRFIDLQTVLRRMTYFGRAESWCDATASLGMPSSVKKDETHWRCVCLDNGEKPEGREYVEYTLERKLASCWPLLPPSATGTLAHEAIELFTALKRPKEKENDVALNDDSAFKSIPFHDWSGRLELRKMEPAEGKKLKPWRLVAIGDWTEAERQACLTSSSLDKSATKKLGDLIKKRVEATNELAVWNATLTAEANSNDVGHLLLRCLLRSSGEDIKDGLERPIGTRWVHYAVPRAIYQVPQISALPTRPTPAAPRVTLVRFSLNTATVNRAVLPPLTDTLLFADKFRAAALAWHHHVQRDYPEAERHPRNLCGREDNGVRVEGHDHAFFWPTDEDDDGFIEHISVYCSAGFRPVEVDALRRLLRIHQRAGRPDLLVTPVFIGDEFGPWKNEARVFVSATPYYCPVNLTHGKKSGGKSRSVADEIRRSLLLTGVIQSYAEISGIMELAFADGIDELPDGYTRAQLPDSRYRNALLKAPDEPSAPGLITGLRVEGGNRLVRALAFCRRRRNHMIEDTGRMFRIEFAAARLGRPFSIGSQTHFGLGLFVPVEKNTP